MPSRRVFLATVMIAVASAARGQAVLGPTEDATVAPVGAARFRFANSWQHYNFGASDSANEVLSYSQLRFTTLSMELGLMRGLSATFVAPEAGNLTTNSWYSHQVDTISHQGYLRLDSVVQYSHNGIGDLELGAKFAWLKGPDEQERIALGPGLHVRSALSASYRFATGTPPSPTDQFGTATGSGRTAISAASQTDIMIGHVFWLTAAGRYLWPSTVTRDVQVYGDSITPTGIVTATQSKGNVWSLEATPRVVLGRYFSIGAQYLYLRREPSSFVGTRDSLDASTLDSLSAGTGQFLAGTITYSTVAAYLQGKGGFPIEISYQYTGTLSAAGSIPKQAATNTVTFRFYARMWGSAFKQAPPPPAGAKP